MRNIKTLGLILSSLILLFLVLRISWHFKEKKPMNVFILDKTVTSRDRPKHKAITWILNNERYVKPNNKSYSHKNDYFGFFPVNVIKGEFDFRSIRISEVDEFSEIYDMLYYADCYGVYSFEWYKGDGQDIRSQRVYGGLNQNDYLLMRSMLEKDKLVIAEYEMFGTPTNALIRNKAEELLRVKWKGWTGKFYETFDTDETAGPPIWMKNLFESQHRGIWPEDKSGIVLINNDGIIELLINGEHLNNPIPSIISTEYAVERFGVKREINFDNWFEFVDARDNTIHSSFTVDVTPSGAEILTSLGLTSVFPAVIEGYKHNYFYFCGEFAENPVRMWTAKLTGGKKVNSLLNRFREPKRLKFFRNFYTPLLSSIIEEYHSAKQLEDQN